MMKKTAEHRLDFKHSIACKLIIRIFLFSSLITLLATGFQLYLDYRRDVLAIEERMKQIKESYVESIVRSLWDTDFRSVIVQLEGILKLPDMQYLGIKQKDGRLLCVGILQPGKNIRREFPLVRMQRGIGHDLGTLYVIATLDGVWQRLTDKITVILIIQTIKTFMVSTFIFFLFYFLVGRHLHAIAAYTRYFDMKLSDKTLVLQRKAHTDSEKDELDQVVFSINDMHANLRDLYRFLEKKIQELDKNIAERRRAEEEHRILEEQLHQAQKMEAVGQLAGGVAHDFNNLLQVIIGYGDMITDQLPPDGFLHKNMQEIMTAAQRSAELVRQLLLFSRRGAIQSKRIDLNELIRNLMKMIRRVIGEHISLEIKPGFGIRAVFADPGQIEQVLMNLCVNARDAMPDGGRIIIETENISIDTEYCRQHEWANEGDYVVLIFSDTGCGIPHEIQGRIFEPFFTTKDVGRGTGLGLATVYGIVRSHRGMIHLYSEPGQGTVFKIYLPAAELPVSSEAEETESAQSVRYGNETVLFAEDEEMVRNMVVQFLKKAGYRVFPATDGEEAISLFNRYSDEIEIALLDVVMPKVSGHKVYEHIRNIRPDIPVVFSTGYSRGEFSRNGHYEIIQKPCSPDVFLKKIREVLDARKVKHD